MSFYVIIKIMNKITYLLELYAPGVLRIGMASVVLWFSIQQFLHNSVWTAYVPDSIISLTHMSAPTIVLLNAIFELVFGLAMMFGWYTRLASLLLALHLFDIMWVVGYGEIGVRDFGLAVGTLVVFMNGPDVFCWKQRIRKTQFISASQSDSQIQEAQAPSNFSGISSQGIRRI